MRLAPILLAAALFGQPKEPEAASLEGQVLNAVTGEPVRKALVTLMCVSVARVMPISATTDAKGNFKFVKLTPGEYAAVVRHPAFDLVKVGVRPDGTKGEVISLAPGEAKSGLTVKLIPYGAIAGRVVDADGDPVKDMSVYLVQWEYSPKGRRLILKQSALTDDQGDYRVHDIRPGKYILRVAPQQTSNALSPDEPSFAAVFYPNAADARGAAPVTIAAAQQIRGVDFTLRPARYATLRGRIVAPDDAHERTVDLKVRSGGLWSGLTEGIRDPQGRFEIYGVPPGLFYIVGSYRTGGGRSIVQMPLEVGGNDIEGIELRPLPPMTLNATVRIDGETKHKLAEVHVEFEGADSYQDHDGVNAEGRVTIRAIEPDVYHVSAWGPDLYLKSIQWGTKELAEGELDLTAGIPTKTELAIVMGADGGELMGVVRNENQDPAAAMVVLAPADRNPWRSQLVNAEKDGRFQMTAIAPGRYKLWAFDEVDRQAAFYDPEYLQPFASRGVDIEIQALEKKSLDLKLTVNR
jgi:protocatechuate 3,4-dioxygenase beta subunit